MDAIAVPVACGFIWSCIWMEMHLELHVEVEVLTWWGAIVWSCICTETCDGVEAKCDGVMWLCGVKIFMPR